MDIKSLLSPQDAPPDPLPPPSRPPLPNGNHSTQNTRPNHLLQAQRNSSASIDTLAGEQLAYSCLIEPSSLNIALDLASMQAPLRNHSDAFRNPDTQSPNKSPSISSNPTFNTGSYPPSPARGRSASYINRLTDPPLRSTPIPTPLSDGDLPIMEQPNMLGESAWIDKLYNNMFSAGSIHDRIGVMELCAQAVLEEPYSPKIWQIYGDWMWVLYRRSHDIQDVYQQCELEQVETDEKTLDDQQWSEEDRIIGKDVFNWQMVMDTWKRGIQSTQWHLDQSHLVWNPFLELTMFDISQSPTPERIEEGFRLFHERLCQPHQRWEDTLSSFSTFVGQYDQDNYADAMSKAKKEGQKYQAAYEMRQSRELELQRAIQSGDEEHGKNVFRDYLDWEEQQHHQKTAHHWTKYLYSALCERATLRFPKEPEFWLDFIIYLMESDKDMNILPEVAERATKYCPGSGELWSQRLCVMEACNRPYKEIETIKHNATSTGQLEDNSNMVELIKVESAWCGYLRRVAFSAQAITDSVDVAEMAIRSAIENVARVGRDKYGDAFRGDPEFRVERIYLKFLAQAGQYDEGREMFHRLESTHGDSHFFWERWYLWEMTIWKGTQDRSAGDGSYSIPTHATAALERAIRRQNLDWPEKVVETYLHHCAQHEVASKLIEAQVESRRIMKRVKKLRDQQAAYAAEQTEAHQPSGKRMREDDDVYSLEVKRQRRDSTNDAEKPLLTDLSSKVTAQVKRDRENTSVIVRHLPIDVDELSLRKYFRDCGKIVSVGVSREEARHEATATLEFESPEDSLSAQTKSMKTFDDKPIEVQIGSGTLLWVTNYPAAADEAYLRQLFGRYGDVMEIRFPSLRQNTHRRFCYIQFSTSGQAAAASTALNGMRLEHNHTLTALPSNPSQKKARTGATEEGRELYVGNVHWSANEADVRQFLESKEVMNIESIRIPRTLNDKSKGVAFVVFCSKEDTEQALQSLDKLPFKSRVLDVRIARNDTKKDQATTLIRDRRGSAASSQHGDDARSHSEDVKMGGTDTSPAPDQPAMDQARASERTLALLDVPDTVNDARIRALCESYGPLVKIIFRPRNNGALVEFEDQRSMGEAELHLSGYELIPGHRLRIGTADEVIHGNKKDKVNGSQAIQQSLSSRHVQRPTQGRGGRGGRGKVGVGFNRATYERKNQETASSESTDTPNSRAKSQNDFRALVTGSGEGTGRGESSEGS